jgi:nucleoid-associated protein YgaU
MKRYDRVPIRVSIEGKEYRSTVIYPEVPPSPNDFYVISTAGDRYDTLAEQFYGDYRLWWVIAAANNSEKASLVLEPGIQIRIPFNRDQIVERFVAQNR